MVMVELELGPGALTPTPVLALRALKVVSESIHGFNLFHHGCVTFSKLIKLSVPQFPVL